MTFMCNRKFPVIKRSVLYVYLVFIAGCNHSPQPADENKYPYFKGFIQYINAALDLSLDDIDNKTVFVIPEHSCSQCIESTYEMLIEENISHSVLIIIKDSLDTRYQKYLSDLKTDNRLYFDYTCSIGRFRTNITRPFLLKINNKQPVFTKHITFANIEEVKTYLHEE